MELLEYIKRNYKTPNPAVLRGLGASEDLIEYLVKTPLNTNIKIVEAIVEKNSQDDEEEILPKIIYLNLSTTDTLVEGSAFNTAAELYTWIDANSVEENGDKIIPESKVVFYYGYNKESKWYLTYPGKYYNNGSSEWYEWPYSAGTFQLYPNSFFIQEYD